jgi:nitroimidazol reductase NimA-like FMN-containing flavoprotein (pyridoxamine 5'-phosphate oxidase superfamily)
MTQSNLTGPWSKSQIDSYLYESTIPIRLSAISSNGWPIVVSLWFIFESDRILCASRKQAKVIDFLKNNSRCAFEIARDSPPYYGVRGQGNATLQDDNNGKVLKRLHDRFIGEKETPFRRWLLENKDDEVVISIQPSRLMSWDYRARMTKE